MCSSHVGYMAFADGKVWNVTSSDMSDGGTCSSEACDSRSQEGECETTPKPSHHCAIRLVSFY